MKHGVSEKRTPHYVDIEMPRNTPMGLYIAITSGIFGFAVVWHIWWVAVLALVVVLSLFMIRSFDYDTEYVVSAEEIKRIEDSMRK